MEGQAHIFSTAWWVTVVLVGLVIHLTASYLKPIIDRAGGHLFRSWATRNAVRARKRELRVELLRSSESRRAVAAHEEIRYRLQTLTMLMLVMFLAVIPAHQFCAPLASCGHQFTPSSTVMCSNNTVRSGHE